MKGSAANLGRVLYVRYSDHVLLRNVNPQLYSAPWTLEAVGFLDYEDNQVLRLVMEKGYAKTNCLLILKSTIIERKEIA